MEIGKLKVTNSGRLVEAAQYDRGYSDWIADLPFGSPSEADEMPRAVSAAALLELAPELLALLRAAYLRLDETRDYPEFCDVVRPVLESLRGININLPDLNTGVAR